MESGETVRMLEEKYAEVFDEELRGLERRWTHDKACTLDDIRGILNSLYVYSGNDWTGRGQLQNAVLSATVAAHECFIAKMETAGR